MMGYFPRETATDPESFTGERLTALIGGQVQFEHYHRYLFARTLCESLDVLDVASGEGYGTAQLAQVARLVVGIEYAGNTVRSSVANFARANLSFLQGDARILPVKDASIDVIVSFETIEHFSDQHKFVAEARRVLRPNGRFIVSTPDRETYSPALSSSNPYHVHELGRIEFGRLLRLEFSHVVILTQRAMIGSVVLGDRATTAAPLVFERRGDRFEACSVLPRAPYLIAVASNVPVPSLPNSIYIERSDLDSDALALADCRKQLDARLTELSMMTTVVEQHEGDVARARSATATADLARQSADARADALITELANVRGSLRAFLPHYLPKLKRHLFGH